MVHLTRKLSDAVRNPDVEHLILPYLRRGEAVTVTDHRGSVKYIPHLGDRGQIVTVEILDKGNDPSMNHEKGDSMNLTKQEHQEAARINAVSGVCCYCGKLVPNGCTVGTITYQDGAVTFCDFRCFAEWQQRELLKYDGVATWRDVYATAEHYTADSDDPVL